MSAAAEKPEDLEVLRAELYARALAHMDRDELCALIRRIWPHLSSESQRAIYERFTAAPAAEGAEKVATSQVTAGRTR